MESKSKAERVAKILCVRHSLIHRRMYAEQGGLMTALKVDASIVGHVQLKT
jgi:hypothetical protein